MGQRVRVEGKSPFGAITAHHHAPLLLPITQIESVSDPAEAYGKQPVLLSAEQLASQPNVETDEEYAERVKADLLAAVSAPDYLKKIIAATNDPNFLKKVAPLQKEYDASEFELQCRKRELPEGLPHSVAEPMFKWNTENSNLHKFLHHVAQIFGEGSEFSIVMTALNREHRRVYGYEFGDYKASYCARNKALSAVVAVRWVIGCPNIEKIESILRTQIHRGESEALSVASKNQCTLFHSGQRASTEERGWHKSHPVDRIRPEPNGSDYWVADTDAFRSANNQ